MEGLLIAFLDSLDSGQSGRPIKFQAEQVTEFAEARGPTQLPPHRGLNRSSALSMGARCDS